MDLSYFVYSCIHWWTFELLPLFGYFGMLLWITTYKFLCDHVFSSLRCMPKSSWSYDNSMFNILRTWKTIFHPSFTISHSHQQCMRVSISPHLLLSVFFDWGHPSLYEVVSFIVVLISISLMTNDVKYLFMCLPCLYTFFEEMSI